MQVNSVNSLNFKSNYQLDNENETEKMLEAARTLENMLPDRFVTKTDEEGNEVKQKSAIGTAASFAGAAIVSFFLAKRLITKGTEAFNTLKDSKTAQKAANAVKDFASKQASKIGEKINNSEKLSGIVENVRNSKVADIAGKFAESVKGGINKVGAKNVAAGVGGAAGVAYISKTDSNNDGISDLAQKGVNAYKGTVERLGAIGEAIKVLS